MEPNRIEGQWHGASASGDSRPPRRDATTQRGTGGAAAATPAASAGGLGSAWEQDLASFRRHIGEPPADMTGRELKRWVAAHISPWAVRATAGADDGLAHRLREVRGALQPLHRGLCADDSWEPAVTPTLLFDRIRSAILRVMELRLIRDRFAGVDCLALGIFRPAETSPAAQPFNSYRLHPEIEAPLAACFVLDRIFAGEQNLGLLRAATFAGAPQDVLVPRPPPPPGHHLRRLHPDLPSALLELAGPTLRQMASDLYWRRWRRDVGLPPALPGMSAAPEGSELIAGLPAAGRQRRDVEMYWAYIGELPSGLSVHDRLRQVSGLIKDGPWSRADRPLQTYADLGAALVPIREELGAGVEAALAGPRDGGHLGHLVRRALRRAIALRTRQEVIGGVCLDTLAMVPQAHAEGSQRDFNSYAFDPEVDVPRACTLALARLLDPASARPLLVRLAGAAAQLGSARPPASLATAGARLGAERPRAAWCLPTAPLLDALQLVYWRAWHGGSPSQAWRPQGLNLASQTLSAWARSQNTDFWALAAAQETAAASSLPAAPLGNVAPGVPAASPSNVAHSVPAASSSNVAHSVPAASPSNVAHSVPAASPSNVAHSVPAASPDNIAHSGQATSPSEVSRSGRAASAMSAGGPSSQAAAALMALGNTTADIVADAGHAAAHDAVDSPAAAARLLDTMRTEHTAAHAAAEADLAIYMSYAAPFPPHTPRARKLEVARGFIHPAGFVAATYPATPSLPAILAAQRWALRERLASPKASPLDVLNDLRLFILDLRLGGEENRELMIFREAHQDPALREINSYHINREHGLPTFVVFLVKAIVGQEQDILRGCQARIAQGRQPRAPSWGGAARLDPAVHGELAASRNLFEVKALYPLIGQLAAGPQRP